MRQKFASEHFPGFFCIELLLRLMKPALIRIPVLVCVLFGCLLACQKKVDLQTPAPPEPEQPATISAGFAGRVLDENRKPVNGAVVTVGNKSVNSDINGKFSLDKADVPKSAALVKISRTGYFDGFRTIFAKAGASFYMEVELIPAKKTGEFAAQTGGKINLNGGGSIEFSANTMVGKTDSLPYTGTVAVNTFFIDPTAKGFQSQMPGALRGIQADKAEVALQSFGMLAVELFSAENKPLQLAKGKSAILHFPIPAALAAKAPATIPLWFFDEKTGLWKKEGSAVKTGAEYIGTVVHFSFWNCDYAYPFVGFDAQFLNPQGTALVHALVRIKSTNYGITEGFTDSLGKVSGLVPQGEQLVMEVLNDCSGVVSSTNIGPYNSNANGGVITVTGVGRALITIDGSAVDCSDQPVADGIAEFIIDGGFQRAKIINGVYQITIDRCTAAADSLQIILTNLADNKTTKKTIQGVTSGNYDAGSVKVCEVAPAQFCDVNLNGKIYNFTFPADSSIIFQSGPSTYIIVTSKDKKKNLRINFGPDFKPGIQACEIIDFSDLTISDTKKQQYWLADKATVTITQYAATAGQFMVGNLSTNLTDSTTAKYPFNASFSIRKE
jgi:hypothetical protein